MEATDGNWFIPSECDVSNLTGASTSCTVAFGTLQDGSSFNLAFGAAVKAKCRAKNDFAWGKFNEAAASGCTDIAYRPAKPAVPTATPDAANTKIVITWPAPTGDS